MADTSKDAALAQAVKDATTAFNNACREAAAAGLMVTVEHTYGRPMDYPKFTPIVSRPL